MLNPLHWARTHTHPTQHCRISPRPQAAALEVFDAVRSAPDRAGTASMEGPDRSVVVMDGMWNSVIVNVALVGPLRQTGEHLREIGFDRAWMRLRECIPNAL